MEKFELYAVWDYDRFPFFLVGKVKAFTADQTRVEVEGFSGHTFGYRQLLPAKAGEALKVLCDRMTEVYREQTRSQHNACCDGALEMMKGFNVHVPQLNSQGIRSSAFKDIFMSEVKR